MNKRKFKQWQFAVQLTSNGVQMKPPVNRLNTRRTRARLGQRWWNKFFDQYIK